VESAIVSAATSLFAEVGYEATTVALVAERAGSSVGNVYKYFPNKEAIFAAAVPETFARELKRMTRERVKALENALDVDALAPTDRYHVLSDRLLGFCIENRERVVILLARAQGTPFASFADGFAFDLVEWALEYVSGAYPTVVHTPALRFALGVIYRNFLAGFSKALAKYRRPAEILERTNHLAAYHQGGLKRLFETAARSASEPPRARKRRQ
jgi:AcrR family transcriptional regulator